LAGLICFAEKKEMIQRIQSVFLLLMALSMLSVLFVPIWVTGNTESGEIVILTAFKISYEDQAGLIPNVLATKNVIYIAILAVISALVAFFSISKYENRLTQMKLGALNSLIVGAVVVCNYMAITSGKEMLDTTNVGEFKLGFMLPVVALLFNSLANRFIRRDEKLVQSANRMR
jgi:hypothetical protein